MPVSWAPLVAWKRSVVHEFRFSRDNRILIAIVYCNALAALGLCIASLGPALLELAVQVQSTLTYTGYCFAARSVGYLVGSFGGPLFDRMPGHLALGAGLLLAGIGSACIPAVHSVWLLGFLVALQGGAMGFLDTGANVMLIYQFEAEVGPWMQMMHAAFAIGAFVAPMLLRAVESRQESGAPGVGVGTYGAAFIIIGAYCTVLGVILFVLKSPKARKSAAHGGHDTAPTAEGSGGGDLIHADANALAGVALETLDGTPIAPPTTDVPPKGASNVESVAMGGPGTGLQPPPTPTPPQPNTKRQRWIVVLITALLLCQYVGCEAGYGGFATAYMVAGLGQSEASGQLLTAAYWASIMVGRIAAIPFSLWVPADRYLGVSMAGCVASSLILLAGQGSVGAVWAGTILYGGFMACVFPTAVQLAETYFPVHGTDATVFVVGSAAGEWLLPFIIASLFGNVPGETDIPTVSTSTTVGPSILMWTVAVGCATNMATYFWLVREGRKLRSALAGAAADASTPAGVSTSAGGGSDRQTEVAVSTPGPRPA